MERSNEERARGGMERGRRTTSQSRGEINPLFPDTRPNTFRLCSFETVGNQFSFPLVTKLCMFDLDLNFMILLNEVVIFDVTSDRERSCFACKFLWIKFPWTIFLRFIFGIFFKILYYAYRGFEKRFSRNSRYSRYNKLSDSDLCRNEKNWSQVK